jgi:hypothetical protein
MRTSVFFLAALVLTSCRGDQAAPTGEENRQLDEAANMLNQAPANLEAIDDSALGAADDPEADASENFATGAVSY